MTEDRNINSTPGVETAYFAGGCFWGVEHLMKTDPGVVSVLPGYMGGDVESPSYEQVCTGTTGHAETIEIVFNPTLTTYENLAKLFFEIHDPTHINRQGPDIGHQYRSVVFYTTEQQKKTAEELIDRLIHKGYDVATEVLPAGKFWVAEDYHHDHYGRRGTEPYCHIYTKRF